MSIVYFRGRMVPKEEARVSIFDRGFLFGDGAYATIKVWEGTPLFLETHLDRLQKQCASFGLQMPPCEIEKVVELIEANHAYEGVWRLRVIVSGGVDPVMRLPERVGELMMVVERYVAHPVVPLRLGVFSVPFALCHGGFKSLAHLNRYYVMEEAYRAGRDDAVTVTVSGEVLEAAFGNLFWVEGGEFFTPDPTRLPLHFGVTIGQMEGVAAREGMRVRRVAVKVEELPEGGRFFRCNTMGGIRPIVEIGERRFGVDEGEWRRWVRGYEELVEEEMSGACR